MGNRIYYGEYSLRHWVDLIVKKNITLPEYQRSFVWNKESIERFITSLKDKQFVPPVTIAHYNVNGDENEANLILDGQQRLTSLLLAYLNICLDEKKIKRSEDRSATEDVPESEDENDEGKEMMDWTFREFFKGENNINSIEKLKEVVINDERYKELYTAENSLSSEFWDDTFLGFCYIVPCSDDKIVVQKSFSKTFRDINYFGKSISALESRRSLYFMNETYKDYFEGKTDGKDVLCDLTITESMQAIRIDFVRYLAILSQYKAQKTEENVLKRYSSYVSRESFYADYVSMVVGLPQENHEEKFRGCEIGTLFPGNCWKDRFKKLHEHIGVLKKYLKTKKHSGDFDSWIDSDYYLFGVIYYVLFEGREINLTPDLISEITEEIQEKRKKKGDSYLRTPNRLGNLRSRLKESINIYSKHLRES